jgi:methylated-DNA-[protein]-cysteine S-methyltransferase
VDVAWGTADSPLGLLGLAVTERGLAMVRFGDLDEALDEIGRRLSPRVLRSPGRVDPIRRELEEYFDRRRRTFDVELDWTLTGEFQRRILRAAVAIPYGGVATYGEVAAKAGSPRGSRAAGNALGGNPLPVIVPCHRVVAAGGKLGGYTGGVEKKRLLLDLESAAALG